MALPIRSPEYKAERATLIAEVARIQNRPEHRNHDILTFCGFLDNDEIKLHIERNRGAA